MADNDFQQSVGYKRPPRHTQFQPGRSGNLKGRPKGVQNFSTVIEKELRAPIEVTENGKRKRISKRQAIVKQTVNKAVAGDPKATSIILGEARFQETPNQLQESRSMAIGPDDQQVMTSIVDRIRQLESVSLGSEPPADPAIED